MKGLVIYLSIACATSFVAWRVIAVEHQSVSQSGIVLDLSGSFTGGCSSILGSAEQVFDQPGASAHSTLSVLVLGDPSTANEPRLLGTYPIPFSRQVIEGKQANEQRKQEALRKIWEDCSSTPRTSTSPIFLALKQAVAHLRAEGCKAGSHCHLLVPSDLEENVEQAIKEHIRGVSSNRALPTPIDNRGIQVTFCGIAETAGDSVDAAGITNRKTAPRDPAREDRMQKTWTSLLLDPEKVEFTPYCPKPRRPASLAWTNESTGGNK